jgi:GTP-binding protein HflX
VLNKLDRLPPGTRPAAATGESVALSARTGLGIPDLLAAIDRALLGGRERLEVRIPVHRGDLVAQVHRGGTVLQEVYDDGAVAITALVPAKLAGQIRKAVQAAASAG